MRISNLSTLYTHPRVALLNIKWNGHVEIRLESRSRDRDRDRDRDRVCTIDNAHYRILETARGSLKASVACLEAIDSTV